MSSLTNGWKPLASLLFLCSSAQAQSFDEYICNYNGSQREMNACALRDYKMADKELNDVYNRTMAEIAADKMRQRVLLEEQREWIKRRDARCMDKRDGPGDNGLIDYMTCLQSFTETRTLQLKTR